MGSELYLLWISVFSVDVLSRDSIFTSDMAVMFLGWLVCRIMERLLAWFLWNLVEEDSQGQRITNWLLKSIQIMARCRNICFTSISMTWQGISGRHILKKSSIFHFQLLPLRSCCLIHWSFWVISCSLCLMIHLCLASVSGGCAHCLCLCLLCDYLPFPNVQHLCPIFSPISCV